MDNLHSDMADSGMAVILDNILMYFCMVKEHSTLLKKVLDQLSQYVFRGKLKKWSLLHNSTLFLGFDITFKGMWISELKVQNFNK